MPEPVVATYQRFIGPLVQIRLGEDNDTRQVIPQHSSSCSNDQQEGFALVLRRGKLLPLHEQQNGTLLR
jgi:hypothetical protein